MTEPRRNRMLISIIKHYGAEHQLEKTIEELDELKEAIIEKDRDHIIEEIADVLIMCKQVEILCEGTEEIEEMIDFKIARTIERMEEER